MYIGPQIESKTKILAVQIYHLATLDSCFMTWLEIINSCPEPSLLCDHPDDNEDSIYLSTYGQIRARKATVRIS
jgi:hypothetical protein